VDASLALPNLVGALANSLLKINRHHRPHEKPSLDSQYRRFRSEMSEAVPVCEELAGIVNENAEALP
jgi:hypothetical protein